MIKETWVGENPHEKGLVSHVFEMRRRLVTMQRTAREHFEKSQRKQKRLYDISSCKRRLQVGDKALVFLSIPGSKLEVYWQGLYRVTKVLNEGLNCELVTGKTHKQFRTYHINLLRK